MAHSCDLSTRYTKEVAEKGSIDPCRSCKRQGGATGMLSLLVSYPPHLASFRLLLWACQAVPRPVCGHCRALCALDARFASNPIETTIRARGAASLVSTHAGARGQTQGTHGRLDDQCCGESGPVPFADSLTRRLPLWA